MIKTGTWRLAGSATALLIFHQALASPQADVTELPAVKIAAPEDLTETTNNLLQTPTNNVTTRSRTDVESSQYSNVNSYLRGTPGVFMNRGSEGRGVGLRVRGASAAQGLVTFDGVPLLTALPGLSWLDTISAEALGGVTVVLGSNHAYYASQAVGGTIQLNSKRASENYGLTHAEGGSFGTF
ncbi:TonB-dependent receptor [Methylocaldum sp.]|uniref:TonB-dependent receptor n=1 Tax=Methylocaldum sp. TaxID=1969727 RepID=UPI002D55FEC0|nr:TonB-dependent receptor plug domain-containing protein [Methylocaldum sp.]HYE34831.1 TonB-dependent receptor plug domain-containing protein [Methylocaldum sp.]